MYGFDSMYDSMYVQIITVGFVALFSSSLKWVELYD